ncbi:MAG: hypothetical protein J7K81_00045, partial [Methanophagales archaeon]|nr:hypothetical protein [Methanophagales archaeon]
KSKNIAILKIINHKITQIFTRLFINLPKKTFFVFSFSTGFLFMKKKKCCVNLVKSRGLQFIAGMTIIMRVRGEKWEIKR